MDASGAPPGEVVLPCALVRLRGVGGGEPYALDDESSTALGLAPLAQRLGRQMLGRRRDRPNGGGGGGAYGFSHAGHRRQC